MCVGWGPGKGCEKQINLSTNFFSLFGIRCLHLFMAKMTPKISTERIVSLTLCKYMEV